MAADRLPQAAAGRARRPLRVLYFIGSYGPEVMGNASHEEVILALRARGHNVDVLTQITVPGAPRLSRVIYDGVPVYRVNLAAVRGTLAGLERFAYQHLLRYEYLGTLLRAYRKQLRRKKYDLVHVEGAYPFGLVAALGGRVPYLANVQGADVIDLPDYDYGYRRFPVARLGVSQALRRASFIRVISALLGDYLVSERLAGRDRIAVVLRAIERDAFPADGETLQSVRDAGRQMLSERYGIGLPRPVLMTLSRLHPFKGLEYLVDAMKTVVVERRAADLEPPWLVIAGPSRTTESYGDYRKFLQARAENLGISSYVVFTGQVEHTEVKYHLAGADIFVCPSILEAQNKVVPEAAAVGTPSVVTGSTGIASYLAPLDACVSVRPASAESLAREILALLSDQRRYEQVQQNALQAADTLRVEEIAPQVDDVWYRAAGIVQG
jgi:glycosyltransferase involved in cell wall biosynthesis